MKNRIPAYLLAILCTVLLSAGVLPSAHAETILLSDDFSLDDAARVTDAPINGVAIQHSSADSSVWHGLNGENGASASFTADGAMYVPSGNLGATIALPSFNHAITVQADVQYTAPPGADPGTGWVSVGFQRTPDGSPYSEANVLGRLTYEGGWALHDRGTVDPIASGTIVGFDRTAVHTLALKYDPAAGAHGAISLWVDKINVTGSIPLTDSNQIAALSLATFLMQDTGTNATLDNFRVTEK